MTLGSSTATLRIFEEEKAGDFYIGYLGFKVDFQHRFKSNFPLYFSVSQDSSVLHLSGHQGDGSPRARLHIMANVKARQDELSAKPYNYAKLGTKSQPRDDLELRIGDALGNTPISYERKS